MTWIKMMKNLRDKYIEFFTMLIDRAIAGERQAAHFCDGVVLELYREGDELHWRRMGGDDSGRSEGNS